MTTKALAHETSVTTTAIHTSACSRGLSTVGAAEVLIL
jgi:hypothetical protein